MYLKPYLFPLQLPALGVQTDPLTQRQNIPLHYLQVILWAFCIITSLIKSGTYTCEFMEGVKR